MYLPSRANLLLYEVRKESQLLLKNMKSKAAATEKTLEKNFMSVEYCVVQSHILISVFSQIAI